MLGVRLSVEVEARLERFVRARHRGKSEVARAAIIEYIDRHELDDEFERQLRANAATETSDPAAAAELDEIEASAWRAIDRA